MGGKVWFPGREIVTEESRKKQIEKALSARSQEPVEQQRSHPLPWRGSTEYFPVIDLPIEVPLLNPESHRIRAELEAGGHDDVRKDRTSETSQQLLTRLWRKAHRKFDKLKESLELEGQTEAGVITREGVLIDGNSRLIALRELQLSNRKWIRCAVLPSDATPLELAQLELRLQVRDPVRDPYRLSNELLFIEELAREHNLSNEQIALSLNWHPKQPARGKKKVELYRRLLALIREMQRINPRLPITFFDDVGSGTGKLQQLKELDQKHNELLADGDLVGASRLLETWLVVSRSGFSSVHQIRAVTHNDAFLEEYLIPRLNEQEMFEDRIGALVLGRRGKDADLPGIDLLGEGAQQGDGPDVDLRPLLRLVEKADVEKITLPGGDGRRVDGDEVRTAINRAISGAIADHKADVKADDQLEEPVDAMRKAVRELKRAVSTYEELHKSKLFQDGGRKQFEYQYKQVRKLIRRLEKLMNESGS